MDDVSTGVASMAVAMDFNGVVSLFEKDGQCSPRAGNFGCLCARGAMDRINMQNVEDMQLKQVLAIRLRCAKRW